MVMSLIGLVELDLNSSKPFPSHHIFKKAIVKRPISFKLSERKLIHTSPSTSEFTIVCFVLYTCQI